MGQKSVARPPKATAPQATTAPQAAQAAPKAAAGTVELGSTLKKGSRGDEVVKLQQFLGIGEDGDFGPGTQRALAAWQRANGLDGDGVAGPDTRAALAGHPVEKKKKAPTDELTSPYEDPDKFIPTYKATAASESDMYRKKNDPYAVGAITNPSEDDDLGGKTYGTYQFESFKYADGSVAKDKKGNAMDPGSSTLSRFVNDKDNPYGADMQALVKDKGLAGADFDKKWKELTEKDNKGFGQAQEAFLLKDTKAKVDAWLDAAGVSPEARKDPRLFDLVLGTINQYDSLANGMATRVGAAQKAAGKTWNATEIARALQDDKSERVTTMFKSSPNAQKGIHNRINRERAMFDKALPQPVGADMAKAGDKAVAPNNDLAAGQVIPRAIPVEEPEIRRAIPVTDAEAAQAR